MRQDHLDPLIASCCTEQGLKILKIYWWAQQESAWKGAYLPVVWRWSGSQYQTPPTRRILACKSC
jgi:hypothetical protein